MQKLPFLTFLFILPALSFAQSTSVLDSKNVTWAGVACLDYPIDFPDSLEWAIGFYEATPVKIAADRYPGFMPTGFLASKLFADVWSGALSGYRLATAPTRALPTIWDSLAADQQEPLDHHAWNTWLGHEQTKEQTVAELAGSVQRYRFKTFYFYEKRRRTLRAQLEGAVLELVGPAGQRMTCWIPFFESGPKRGKSPRPETPDYVYVVDVARMVNFERDVVTLKGSVEVLFCDWIWCPLEKRRSKGYAFRDDALERRKAVKFKQYWKQYGERRDTMLIPDPETLEERVTVIDRSVNWREVRRASLQQRFFYDDRRKTMLAEVRMVSPAVPRYDEEGNFRFDVPLVHVPVVRR